MAATQNSDRTPDDATVTDDQDHVLELQRKFDQAELTGDREVLRELVDDDFLSIGPKGFVLDKNQWIDRHDFFSYHELDTSDVDVRQHGETIIIRNVQRNRATSSGHPVQITTRVCQVWVRRGSRWQLASIQFSPLAGE